MKSLRLSLAAVLTLLLASCASKPASTAQTKPAEKGYVNVQGLGSWIPRKVSAQGDIIGDKSEVTDTQLLERARRNTQLPKDPEQSSRGR